MTSSPLCEVQEAAVNDYEHGWHYNYKLRKAIAPEEYFLFIIYVISHLLVNKCLKNKLKNHPMQLMPISYAMESIYQNVRLHCVLLNH